MSHSVHHSTCQSLSGSQAPNPSKFFSASQGFLGALLPKLALLGPSQAESERSTLSSTSWLSSASLFFPSTRQSSARPYIFVKGKTSSSGIRWSQRPTCISLRASPYLDLKIPALGPLTQISLSHISPSLLLRYKRQPTLHSPSGTLRKTSAS